MFQSVPNRFDPVELVGDLLGGEQGVSRLTTTMRIRLTKKAGSSS